MHKNRYNLPDRTTKENQEIRQVGIEIEMSGIELPMIVCQALIAYSGKIEEISPYEFIVRDSQIGDVKIELDSRYLKKAQKEKFSMDSEESERNLQDYTTDVITALSKNIIPCEIATAPIPVDKLNELDPFIELLRNHGAKGTRHSIFYAFGVHLNPELPNLETETILNYFKAFLCLQDWIITQEQVDYTRKISPFIDLFPKEYISKVLSPNYHPNIEQFIDDYLLFNPTRNRVLDLLPLFSFLNEEKIRKALPSEKINKRPTLHYRLPNSDIDNPDWGLWQCWNDWVHVESLANNKGLLNKICDAYLSINNQNSGDLISVWTSKVTELLQNR